MKKVLLMLALAGLLVACASDPYRVPHAADGKGCTPIKEIEGSSAGMLIFGCIPAGRNGMTQRAYSEALQLSGGDVLLKPVYEDSWAWTPVGNLFFVTVKGTAAKCN